MADLTRDDVLRFLHGLDYSARTKHNFSKSLRTFFAFARDHGYLAKDDDELRVYRTQTLEDQNRATAVGADPTQPGAVAGALCAGKRASLGLQQRTAWQAEG
jgi:hypothetical protein